MPDPMSRRILLVDENPAIHEDFDKIFHTENENTRLAKIEEIVFPDKVKQTNTEQTVSWLIDSAYQGEQALRLVQEAIASQHPYVMAFIDLRLTSGGDGIATIQHLWEIDPDFQVVICTAYADCSWKELTKKLYFSNNFLILNKPFNGSEIRQVVRYLISKWEKKNQIQEQICQLEMKIDYQKTHDSLTGLGNRKLAADRIQQAIEQAKQPKQFVGVLFIALNNLKEINTVFGYAISDAFIKLIAEKLKNNCSEADTVIRSGEDEFIVVLAAQASEESLVAKINQLYVLCSTPWKIANHSLSVTVKIGAAIYPGDGEEPATLLKDAGAALYHAEKMNNSRIQFYIKEYHDSLSRRMELIASLHHALDARQFLLHYQPLVKSDSGQILGVEALIRWRHPSFGLLYPQEFISLAEETGLILAMEEWVLKTACVRVKKWQESIFPELRIAVNVSVSSISQTNFAEQVYTILKKTELQPHYLELEIIASHRPTSSEILQQMRKLKEMGIHFSISHFGTGYANLNYLQYLPLDKIKIDKSFINTIQLNDKENRVVEAVIDLAKKLRMEVVAEGVEKPEQVEFLFNHHGGQMQGYYFSPPLDEEACARLLQKQVSQVKEAGV